MLSRLIVFLALLLTAAIAINGCDRADVPAKRDVSVVEVWHPFGQELMPGMRAMVQTFERSHPDIRIQLVYAANNLTSSQKLFLSIAGGKAPDVTFVDGQQLAEWAARGALADLTDAVAQSGITGDDFWGPRWDESRFAGRVYALPWCVDPNFALVWNKQLFREAGLDPEVPPRTIAELDDYNRKLTRFDERGNLMSVGLVPWQWGGDNSVFTWAYAFGGTLYEPPPEGSSELAGRVTANGPRVVAAMGWMKQVADEMGVRKVSQFNSGFVGAGNNPFYLGKQAMFILHMSQLKALRLYAPTIEYGLGYLPAAPGGEYPTGWLGGWSLGIPRGNEVSPAAFEFIRWACATEEGAEILATGVEQLPAYRKASYYERVRTDPALAKSKVFCDILERSKHVRTLMPVQGYLMELLRRATDQVLYGGRDPQEALDEVTRLSQSRLDDVIRTVEQRLSDAGDQPRRPE